jgi:1,2-diacylglycerol 3-alpha-glucosyltransferase
VNIGIFTDTYKPQLNGVVTVVKTLERELVKKGHKVYIFTVETPGYHQSDSIEENVYRLPSIKFFWEPNLRLGFPDYFSPLRAAKKWKLDIVHSHTPFTLGSIGHFVAKKLKIPEIHTYHTMYEEYANIYLPLPGAFLRFYAKSESKRFCERTTAIVAPSKKIKKVLLDYGITKPIVVLPNGIDLSPFLYNIPTEEKIKEFKSKWALGNSKVIIFVGRMADEKNIDVLLMNFKKVVDVIKNVKLLMVGDGPKIKKYKELAKMLDINDRVIFTGFLKNWPEELSIAYHSAHLFATASHTEVHPMTFIEAMASSLPVVAAYDGSIADMVDGNGFLFEDDKKLYEGIIKILSDDLLQKTMSERSSEISKMYSVDRFIKNSLNLYEMAMNGRIEVESFDNNTGL